MASTPKRVEYDSPRTNKDRSCPLLHILTQYGLLAAIASNLFPRDLYALAATSKDVRSIIFSRDKSHVNLLRKMSCDGSGVEIRKRHHRRSRFFAQFNCTEYVQCGTHDATRTVETHPCANCLYTTCDECRVHCVYQSISQPPDEPDEMPQLSGFALLSHPEMGILTPSHLNSSDPISPTNSAVQRPFHDQGFLDIPLESDKYAPAESITEILNFNLGSGPLRLSISSTWAHPSPVIQAFWDISEQRKRRLCHSCFLHETTTRQCECTLRKRFVDRWLCLGCYQRETKDIRRRSAGGSQAKCAGCAVSTTAPRSICLWCMGEALELASAT